MATLCHSVLCGVNYLRDCSQLHCPTTRDGFAGKENLFYDPIKNWDVRWNWEKFLVDRSGRPVIRYDASTHPNDIDADIAKLIVNSP